MTPRLATVVSSRSDLGPRDLGLYLTGGHSATLLATDEEEETSMAKTMEKADKVEKTPAVGLLDWSDMFERWFADFPRPRFWPELRGSFDGLHPLRVEEFTEGDHMIVRAEMPGIDPDKDVQINVSEHTLHLRAERREESTTEEKGSYRSEFHYGSFARTVPLPVGATDKDVKATYRDGILEIRIPVDSKEVDAKKVPIQRV